MTFPITTGYAIALAILMLMLWINVTRTRGALKISIGDGDQVVLHERMRRHGNFIEWVPFAVLLMMLAEAAGAGAAWLHAAGAILLVSRLLHPFGLHADNPTHPLRIIGNSGSILALAITLIALGWATYGG